MTFELRGPKAKPEALVEFWPQDYWEDYKHPTRQAQLELGLADPTRRLKMWMNGEARELTGFLFYGLPGYGKTGVGLMLLLTAARQGYLTRFMTAATVAAERDSTTFSLKDGKTSAALLDWMVAPEVLLIDDVGTKEYSASMRELLLETVRKRKHLGHLTLMTTNLPLETQAGQEQFAKSMDARILSSFTGCAYNAGAWAHDVAPGKGSLRAVVKP